MGSWNAGSKNGMFGKTGEKSPRWKKEHTEETKRKISEANKGKLTGDKNPSKRLDVRKKISKAKTGIPRLKGKDNPCYNEERHSFVEKNQGKHFCKECESPISIKIWHYTSGIPKCCSKKCSGKFRSGVKNGRWEGGKSFGHYCPKFTEKIKEEIREQYNRACIICGKTEEDNAQKLCVHHVDYNKDQGCNGHNWKLVPLCRTCHSQTNSNREHWEEYLKEMII